MAALSGCVQGMTRIMLMPPQAWAEDCCLHKRKVCTHTPCHYILLLLVTTSARALAERKARPVLSPSASDRAFFLSFACQLLTYQPPPASAAPADPARSVPGTSAALAALLRTAPRR